jgi:hypothetical protein
MLSATLVVRKQKLVRISFTSPIAPSRTASSTAVVCGWQRYMNPSITTRPACWAASNISSACAAVTAKGFSHSTCLPARRAARVHSWCIELGSDT